MGLANLLVGPSVTQFCTQLFIYRVYLLVSFFFYTQYEPDFNQTSFFFLSKLFILSKHSGMGSMHLNIDQSINK